MKDLDSFCVDIVYFKKQGDKYISEKIEEIDHGVGEVMREIKEKAKRRASELEAYIEVARWNDNGSIKSDFYFPSGDRIAGFHNGNPYIADDFNRPL